MLCAGYKDGKVDACAVCFIDALLGLTMFFYFKVSSRDAIYRRARGTIVLLAFNQKIDKNPPGRGLLLLWPDRGSSQGQGGPKLKCQKLLSKCGLFIITFKW